MHITPADFTDPRVIDLVRLHLAGMHANSPPGHSFALDLSGLDQPDVTLFILWLGDAAVGMGALKALSPLHGELKSMRTHPDYLRRGLGAAMLDHLIATARSRGYHRLSLETGSGPPFEPALALYRSRGFANGEAFADYTASHFNQFLRLALAGA
jgi:putative acetyltransferase